jgi:hypothetical protein
MRYLVILLMSAVFVVSAWAQRCGDTRGAGPDPALRPVFEKLMKASERVSDARTPASSAEAWFQLNEAADEFAEALNHVPGAQQDPEKCANVALDAGAMGIPIHICEYSRSWVARPQGYLIYHQFLPNGLRAEDAWWYGELGNTPHRCVDYAGTKDEGEYYVPLYKDFLRHFPNGKHAAEAKEMLKGFEHEANVK